MNVLSKDRGEKIDWSKIEMHDMLPVPESKVGKIYSNSEDRISVSFYKTSEDEYKNYVSQCENLGFTVDPDSSSSNYRAYNSDGYKLDVNWYDKKMSIELEAPMKFTEIQWPSSSLGKMLPRPKSNQGKFSSEYDDGFFLYVANTSPKDYAEYVKKCSDAGFNVDYSKGDDYYNAKNKQGYTVSLKYEGYNIMSIDMDAPSGDSNKDAQAANTTAPAKASNKDKTTAKDKSVGLGKEFKAAMDSYEAFIDEYVAFMKKYEKSDGTDPQMIADYGKYINKYTEMAASFAKWEDEDLNAAETAYYIRVQGRVSQKLLEVAQ